MEIEIGPAWPQDEVVADRPQFATGGQAMKVERIGWPALEPGGPEPEFISECKNDCHDS